MRSRRSIGIRFSVSTLVLVLALSAAFVGAGGYRSYRREVRRLNTQLQQIEQSHVPAIVSSLWLTDYELLEAQMEAIARFPYVERVEVVDDEGSRFSAGATDLHGLAEHSRPLTYSRRGTSVSIGSFHLFVNQAGLRAEALRTELFSAVAHLVLAGAIAAAVALLFRRQVGVHLVGLAQNVESTAAPGETSSYRLSRERVYGDELDRLVDATNEMRRRLEADVRERELLMSEVHHRIKNDIGFVHGLLALQAGRSDIPETVSALNEASRRVAVMGRIYEQLYRGDDFRTVETGPLVERIVGEFRARQVVHANAVELSVESFPVSTRISVALGVILNELVTNAAKYAFDGVGEPRIAVTVRPASDAWFELTVADNGGGVPDDVARGERSGYGLTIVNALVDQHDGSFDLKSDHGAVAVVRLPSGR